MTRRILVAGGDTGIGLAIARHFIVQGDQVITTRRRAEPLETAANPTTVRSVVCDHTDPDALLGLLPHLPDRLDILVNNAGGNVDLDASGTAALVAYARAFRVNLDAYLLSAALTTKAVEDRLAEGGAVIHIGYIPADKDADTYRAASVGLASWNIELARRLGPRSVTANILKPEYVEDEEFHRHREQWPDLAEGIVSAVSFLASAYARNITGHDLYINSGVFDKHWRARAERL